MIAEFGMLSFIGLGLVLISIGIGFWLQEKRLKYLNIQLNHVYLENSLRQSEIQQVRDCLCDEIQLRQVGLEEEKDLTKAKFERLNGIVEKVNSLQGLMTKTIISSKVAAKQAQTAFDLGNEAVLRVGALEKSTHKIQLMPLDQMLARNKAMETKANKVFNPENEINDYLDNGILDGLLGDEELDV